jgi:hypothetical protein
VSGFSNETNFFLCHLQTVPFITITQGLSLEWATSVSLSSFYLASPITAIVICPPLLPLDLHCYHLEQTVTAGASASTAHGFELNSDLMTRMI